MYLDFLLKGKNRTIVYGSSREPSANNDRSGAKVPIRQSSEKLAPKRPKPNENPPHQPEDPKKQAHLASYLIKGEAVRKTTHA